MEDWLSQMATQHCIYYLCRLNWNVVAARVAVDNGSALFLAETKLQNSGETLLCAPPPPLIAENTNFYLQQLRKKNKLSNIYALVSALEEKSVGCFVHPSQRARGTARASVHSSSQCLHTRGKRALGTTQCASQFAAPLWSRLALLANFFPVEMQFHVAQI